MNNANIVAKWIDEFDPTTCSLPGQKLEMDKKISNKDEN